MIAMLGGHVVKTGLAPLLVDLMRRGVITHLAMNGSAAIHDYEVARFGATSDLSLLKNSRESGSAGARCSCAADQ